MPSVGVTHDIRIGSDYFLIRPGGYTKRAAPLFGARFTTGDPDYNNLSFWQHWAQTCWVGGFGAETWMDDAMFDEGVGIDASQHEVMVLSRDLGPANRTVGNWDLNNEAFIRIFNVFNGKLYALQTESVAASRLYRFDDASSTWVLVKTFGSATGWYESFGGYLWFGPSGANMEKMDTSEVFTNVAKPAGKTDTVRAMKVYRGKLYCGFGRDIFRLKSDFTWDGSTAFYTAEDVNYLNQSEVHLGFLYFASRNGHILRTDGNNTFDLWAFEPHTAIWGMRSFDGRLFIGAAEELAGTTSMQTVLYQFSGSAVTELKRWGKVGYDTTPGKLRAIGRYLFFGASNLLGMGSRDGFGIGMYDPVEDAYHLFSTNQDNVTYPPGTEGVNTTVDDVFFWKGYLYCTVRGYGIFRTKWSYKDVTRFQATYDTTAASGGGIGATNGGWYTSSDFDAGTPGLRKLWNAITVHIDLPTTDCEALVQISSDGGQTWSYAGGSLAAAVVQKTSSATRYSKTIILQNNTAGVDGYFATRLKYRITMATIDTTRSPQLRGVIVRYVPVPEPNWLWDITIVLSDTMLLHDGTLETVDIDAKLAALEASFRAGELVEFQDIDGKIWAATSQPGVLIMDMVEQVPLITASADGDREREVRLVLHEAVESY